MRHPNAVIGGAAGIGGGEIVVEIADRLGWTLSTGWGIAIAGGITSVVLFVGRNGLKGVWRTVVHGNKPE